MIADYSFFHKIFCSEPVDAFQTAKQSVQLESIKSKGKLAKNIFYILSLKNLVLKVNPNTEKYSKVNIIRRVGGVLPGAPLGTRALEWLWGWGSLQGSHLLTARGGACPLPPAPPWEASGEPSPALSSAPSCSPPSPPLEPPLSRSS